MSIRRSILGLTGAAVLTVAACSGASSSGSPRLTLPSIAIPSSLPSAALEGFCADFKSKVDTAWPNIDASTAAAIAPAHPRVGEQARDVERQGRRDDDRDVDCPGSDRHERVVAATGRDDRVRSPEGVRRHELLARRPDRRGLARPQDL